MKIWKLFKRNKNKNKNEKLVSIEELENYLSVLAELGIESYYQDFAKWCWEECGNSFDKEDPYTQLLYSLGDEYSLKSKWQPVTNDVYWFDTECIDEPDSYEEILVDLSKLTKGVLEVKEVKSMVDHEKEEAFIEFVHHGTKYNWDLNYENDWFDCGLLAKLNALLTQEGSEKRFYGACPDQCILIIFSEEEKVKKLNQLVSISFECDFDESIY